jgi:murein tripeptide amidase MpaA
MEMMITTNFDSGSISIINADHPQNINLRLRGDNRSCNAQWFHFRLDTTAQEAHKITIVDAGSSTFAAGWSNYQAVASYDGQAWFRVPTHYNGKDLVIDHTPEHERVDYAYFPPYSQARQQQVLTDALTSKRCTHISLGRTPEQRSIDLLVVGRGQLDEGAKKKKVWIIARQHPGETMAQWFIEGLIGRLLSNDETAEKLLDESTFYIVANMNPDGSAKGNHRTNATGVNLNSIWHEPSQSEAPEVYYVRKAMHAEGVDLFLDIHGDEEIPYSFMMGGKSSKQLTTSALNFKRHYEQVNANFQVAYDYDTHHAAGGQSCCGSSCSKNNARTIATDYVESAFGCLALFLEMPFKASDPDNQAQYVNPQDICKGLGASLLDGILHGIPKLTT